MRYLLLIALIPPAIILIGVIRSIFSYFSAAPDTQYKNYDFSSIIEALNKYSPIYYQEVPYVYRAGKTPTEIEIYYTGSKPVSFIQERTQGIFDKNFILPPDADEKYRQFFPGDPLLQLRHSKTQQPLFSLSRYRPGNEILKQCAKLTFIVCNDKKCLGIFHVVPGNFRNEYYDDED